MRRSTRFPGISSIVLIWLICFSQADPASAKEMKTVRGKGEVVIENITPEQGRLLALQRARANAVEQAAGISIRVSTLIKDFLLVGDFLKAFSSGYVVAEGQPKWEEDFVGTGSGPRIPRYRVEIEATVMVPEKAPGAGFALEARMDRETYHDGDKAFIKVKSSRKAHLAISNLRADDKVEMQFPLGAEEQKMVPDPGQVLTFPQREQGKILEMATLPGHDRDTEAYMVVAVPVVEGKTFSFADFFEKGRLYTVPEFFERYSRFAETAEEKILPYEVRKKEVGK